VSDRNRLTFRCHIDKHEWSAIPNSILRGSGCPKCKFRKLSVLYKRSNKIISRIGDRLVVDVSTPSHPNGTMAILAKDLETVNTIGRAFIGVHGYCYVNCGHQLLRVHRIVMGVADPVVEIDHKDGNRTNNLRDNLRECTSSQNKMNMRRRKDNTSGEPGVYRHKQTDKWQAYITVDGKTRSLGLYERFEDAVAARREAVVKYFGEFAYDPAQNATLTQSQASRSMTAIPMRSTT